MGAGYGVHALDCGNRATGPIADALLRLSAALWAPPTWSTSSLRASRPAAFEKPDPDLAAETRH